MPLTVLIIFSSDYRLQFSRGTLVMPYCSGIGNLAFVFIIGMRQGPGAEVITNSLVNNVTNLILLIALPTVIWNMNVLPQGAKAKKGAKARQHEVNRLSLLLTLAAVFFFTGITWALGGDGRFDFRDGLVLVGAFLFYQCFHVFDVLKSNARQNKKLGWRLPIDLALLAIGAYVVFVWQGLPR